MGAKKLTRVPLLLITFFLIGCASPSTVSIPTGPGKKVETLNNIGYRFYEKQRYQDAQAYFSAALEINPSFVDALVNRSAAYVKLRKYKDAIRDASRALKIMPRSVQALNNRANAHTGLGHYSRALKDYKDAYQLQPNFLDVIFNIANLYYRLNLRVEAVRYYTQALNIHPSLTEAYIFRGLSQYQLGYEKRGLEDLSAVINMKGRTPAVTMQLAKALLTVKRFEEAEKILTELLLVFNTYADAYYLRAEVYYHLGRYNEAQDDLQKAVDNKKSISANVLMAKIRKKLKN